MITDRLPRSRALLEEFRASDQVRTLEVPADDRLRTDAKSIEAAMQAERRAGAQGGLRRVSAGGGRLYVSVPEVRVPGARQRGVAFLEWFTYWPERETLSIAC
jgi:hypothetical protein